MKTPHKHAATIKAWADGAEIQCRNECDRVWKDMAGPNPCWFEDLEYRVKPEPKPDFVYFGVFNTLEIRAYPLEAAACFTKFQDVGDQLKLVFDGETGKLKSAEVL
jgi:hypothetical protein